MLIADHNLTCVEDAFERGAPARIHSDKLVLPIWKRMVAQVCVAVKAAKLHSKEKTSVTAEQQESSRFVCRMGN